MSSSIDTIGHKLQTLEERLQAENESRDLVLPSQMPGPRQSRGGPRPQHLGEITPTRPKKPLNLPVIQPPQAVETETDRKLKKIMKQNGVLTINGISYQSDIKDLEHIGDLGNGTSGHVVKMRHVPSGAIIAVKQMRRTGNSEENKRILMDLDVVLKSHDCKYIVQCLGCFITDLDVWICMELMAMCFDKLLKLSKMPVPEQILGKVTVATVKALSYLKEKQDVIHRDVKPSNILIDERGNIKLCDFGISGRLVDSKANTRSAGCAAYMAPERIDPKKPKYDIRADVWSLGITLVELATACSPYEGCKTDFEVLTKVLDSDPPNLPKDQGFSQEFQDFVSKCLKKNHTFRPKYPELLEQPFIKIYETKFVDVPAWFRSVVEMTGIKPHRRISSPSEIASSISVTSVSSSLTTTFNNRPGIPLKMSQIPNYQTNLNKTFQNQNIQQQQQQQQQHHHHHQNLGNKNLISNSGNNSNYQKLNSQSSSSSISSTLSSSTSSSLPQPITKSYVYQPLPKETNGYTQSILKTNNSYHQMSGGSCIGGGGTGGGGGGVGVGGDEVDIVSEMNKLYKKSPFVQRKPSSDTKTATISSITANYGESPKKESVLSSLGQSLIRNITTSSFSNQKKIHNQQQQQPEGFWKFSNPPDGGGGGGIHNFNTNDNTLEDSCCSATSSPIGGRKRFQTTVPVLNDNSHGSTQYARLPGNTSPIVLQRFYHQQNQLREKELEKQKQHQHQIHDINSTTTTTTTNPFLNSFIPKYHYPQNQIYSPQNLSSSQNVSDVGYHHHHHPQHHHPQHHHNYQQQQQQQQPHHHNTASISQQQYHQSHPTNSHQTSISSLRSSFNPMSNIPIYSQQSNSGPNSGYNNSGVQNLYSNNSSSGTNNLYGRASSANKESSNLKDEQGWFNSIAGVVKKQFASYVKLHSDRSNNDMNRSNQQQQHNNFRTMPTTTTTMTNNLTTNASNISSTVNLAFDTTTTTTIAATITTATTPAVITAVSSSLIDGNNTGSSGTTTTTTTTTFVGLVSDRRHRSPDPPPRYNRGQSPLLFRKNLLELSKQLPGSPLLPRRYTTASPPLPPPRRGSESVPGSPQHFRTRIHYTPEPQRRIYRTIDQ